MRQALFANPLFKISVPTFTCQTGPQVDVLSGFVVTAKLAHKIWRVVGTLSLASGSTSIKLECLVESAHKTTGAWCLLCVWQRQCEGKRNCFKSLSLKLKEVQRGHNPTHRHFSPSQVSEMHPLQQCCHTPHTCSPWKGSEPV